jgi:hypothetical protein
VGTPKTPQISKASSKMMRRARSGTAALCGLGFHPYIAVTENPKSGSVGDKTIL